MKEDRNPRDQPPPRKRSKLGLIIHVLAHPVEDTAFCLHYVGMAKSNKRARIYCGVFMMALGSTMAHNIPHEAPMFIQVTLDFISYGVHGLGLAPIAKVIADAIGVEI